MLTNTQRKAYWAQFSFVPEQSFEEEDAREVPRVVYRAHDAATEALIDEFKILDCLPYSDVVRPLLDKWVWEERMGSAETKQQLLEPLIRNVQDDPEANHGELIFLLIVLEPLRRSVTKRLLRGAQGIGATDSSPSRSGREEARRIATIEREEIFHQMRCATIELLHRYGFNTQRGRFFGWFKETLSWRATDVFLRNYLPHTDKLPEGEAEAVQRFLHGFEELDPPPMKVNRGVVTGGIGVGPLYQHVDAYRQHRQVRGICQEAVGRLPLRMREVVESVYWQGASVTEIANARLVAKSTVSHTKRNAERKLHDDDQFFCALAGLDLVRDAARLERLKRDFPDGLAADGRRLVYIGDVD